MEELIKKVEEWSIDKGLDKADPLKQLRKISEEVTELCVALGKYDTLDFADDRYYDVLHKDIYDEIVDAYGDVLVTLIVSAHQNVFNLKECLEHAYNEIKDRQGILVDDNFVEVDNIPGFENTLSDLNKLKIK